MNCIYLAEYGDIHSYIYIYTPNKVGFEVFYFSY